MQKIPLTFITGNKNKLAEVQAILGADFELDSIAIDLPELQASPEELAKLKCMEAYAKAGVPVITEDTSLCFNALNGLPGPYIKWFLESVGHDGLNRMLAGFDDKTAYAQCIFAYYDGKLSEPIVFIGRTAGAIVPARGPTNFGWDPVFEAHEDGVTMDKTYAELDKIIKNSISHRKKSLDALQKYMRDNKEAVIAAHLEAAVKSS